MQNLAVRSAALAVFALAACSKPKEKVVTERVEVPVEKIVYIEKEAAANAGTGEGTGSGSGTGTGSGSGSQLLAASTDITFAGSLALSVEGGASLRLWSGRNETVASYALNCVTFGDNPDAARIALSENEDGSFVFKGTLTDFAGQTFGCFVLNGETPLAPIIFGGDSSVLAGAGDLYAAINYNDGTKSAAAVIDLTKSSALAEDAVADALEAKGAKTTDVSGLTGTYAVACDSKQQGFSCNDTAGATSVPDKLFLSQFEVGGKTKLAIWKSKAGHDSCVPPNSTATDDDPSFVLKIGSNNLPLNFDSQADFNTSLDANYQTVRAAGAGDAKFLADALERTATERSRWEENFCAQNPFSNGNCKYVTAETDSYTYFDWATNKDVTYTYVRWMDDAAYNAASDYTGTVTSQFLACSQNWAPDKELCPVGTATDDKGNGTYQAFFGKVGDVDKRLRLVCRDPQYNYIAYQEYASANNKTDAMANASTAKGCDPITSGVYNGHYQVYRSAVRAAFSEITATAVNFGAKLCENYAVPADFKFSDCTQADVDQLMYTYWEPNRPSWVSDDQPKAVGLAGWEYYYAKDRGKQELCRWKSWALQNSSTDATTGKVTAAANSIQEWQGPQLCPTAFATYEANGRADYALFQTDCVTEFNGLNANDQVGAALKARIGTWDTLRYIGCTASDPVQRQTFQDSFATMCLPQVRIEYVCGGGGCAPVMRCPGTKGGKCTDEFGGFIGKIGPRIASMELKAQTDGAFQATNTVSDRWVSCDFTKAPAKMKNCTLTNDTVINAKIADDASGFSSFYKERVKQNCEEVEEAALAQACFGGGTAAAGGGQNNNQNQQNSEAVQDTDILKRLIFTKCANPTCT